MQRFYTSLPALPLGRDWRGGDRLGRDAENENLARVDVYPIVSVHSICPSFVPPSSHSSRVTMCQALSDTRRQRRVKPETDQAIKTPGEGTGPTPALLQHPGLSFPMAAGVCSNTQCSGFREQLRFYITRMHREALWNLSSFFL